MRRFTSVLAALILCLPVAACGSGLPVPLPVPPTPTLPAPTVAPQPPPGDLVETVEGGGFCSHHALDTVARFHGHYNASDGGHYHGWTGFAGESFWVQC